MVKVNADDFYRIISNLHLFQVGKNAPAMTIEVYGDIIKGSISDNLTYVTDTSVIPDGVTLEAMVFALSATSVKELISWLNQEENATVDTLELQQKFNGGDLMLIVSAPNAGEFSTPFAVVNEFTMQSWDEILFQEHWDTPDTTVFEVNPERWAKLNRLKSDSKYPLSMMVVEHIQYGTIVVFKYGPTITGALTTLDREILAKKDGADDFLW